MRELTVDSMYRTKDDAYFSGSRADIVADLPLNPAARALEIGCGRGATGRAALDQGKAGYYFGVELDPEAAAAARTCLSGVLCGNIEEADLEAIGGDYDVLILSEVLEHLVDPWTTLSRLTSRLRPGALVYASSPNVSNYRLILDLLRGRFQYAEVGVMDRTHLRWFTPNTFQDLFESAGFQTISVGPVWPLGPKARVINRLTGARAQHLFHSQVGYKGTFVGRA